MRRVCQPSATFRRFCQTLAKPLQAVCQCLAISLLVCQCLANAGCATESRMDALVADMAARHAALLEAAQ